MAAFITTAVRTSTPKNVHLSINPRKCNAMGEEFKKQFKCSRDGEASGGLDEYL
jgi:hypothetical protein